MRKQVFGVVRWCASYPSSPQETATTTNEDNFTDPGFDNWKSRTVRFFPTELVEISARRREGELPLL
jgi:hypothetical protein